MSSAEVDAVVVGAGIAGLYQLHRFHEMGLTAMVLEAADGVGGTWYWNRYPGARCDVESQAYSYSFSPELEQEWTWTERYPTQPEILRYLNHVADRFDLRKDIRFNTRVTGAGYDEDTHRWLVVTAAGDTLSAQYLVMATGCLSESKTPEIPGIDRFHGPSYHTGHWPHDAVDLTGLRVGIIGTGSSGVQTIPVIAQQASELTVFQRTPNFSMPAGNRPLSGDEIAAVKIRYRDYRQQQKTSNFGVPVAAPTQSAREVSEAQRQVRYQAAWENGNLVAVLGAYNDTLTDKWSNDTASEFLRSKIRDTVHDPEVAETLSPRSYPFGTKRPCMDSGYYATFNSPHVHLVDLRRAPLAEITEKGIRTADQHYEVDAIVFATGFDAMTGALTAIDIRGRGGVSLKEKWGEGPRTYLGLTLAGFPNLFTITGPLSPSVLSNMVVSIEQHVDFIGDLITSMRKRGVDEVEATIEAETGWVDDVAEAGSYTLFPTADSWYMGSNVPGKARVFMAYILGVNAYREQCDQIAANEYQGFAFASS